MHNYSTLGALAALFLCTSAASAAECTAPSTCVPKDDLSTFVAIAKQQRCHQTTTPTFTMDPVTIVIDKEGRVYGSGSQPVPWRLTMKWCGDEAQALGNIKLIAAVRQEAQWGFRFRTKASMGVLGVEAFKRDPWTGAVDVGVLLEPFFYHAFNLNAAVGIKSVGAGVGIDVTRNFGAYFGYALAFSEWRSNPYAGLYFSF